MESKVGQKPKLKNIYDMMAEATWLPSVPLNSFIVTEKYITMNKEQGAWCKKSPQN